MSDSTETSERFVMMKDHLFEGFKYVKGLQHKFPIANCRRGGQFRNEFTFAVSLIGNNGKSLEIAFRERLRDNR